MFYKTIFLIYSILIIENGGLVMKVTIGASNKLDSTPIQGNNENLNPQEPLSEHENQTNVAQETAEEHYLRDEIIGNEEVKNSSEIESIEQSEEAAQFGQKSEELIVEALELDIKIDVTEKIEDLVRLVDLDELSIRIFTYR